MLSSMFVVSEAAAAAIRAIFEQRGELSAVIELRRLFPGITDNAQARECARTIAGWKPLPGGRGDRHGEEVAASAGRVELLPGIEGVSSRPVREIVASERPGG
jgi:hypothetical protein